MLTLFPPPREYDDLRRQEKLLGVKASPETLAAQLGAGSRDHGHLRFGVVPVFALAFASAYLVAKRLKPKNQ